MQLLWWGWSQWECGMWLLTVFPGQQPRNWDWGLQSILNAVFLKTSLIMSPPYSVRNLGSLLLLGQNSNTHLEDPLCLHLCGLWPSGPTIHAPQPHQFSPCLGLHAVGSPCLSPYGYLCLQCSVIQLSLSSSLLLLILWIPASDVHHL